MTDVSDAYSVHSTALPDAGIGVYGSANFTVKNNKVSLRNGGRGIFIEAGSYAGIGWVGKPINFSLYDNLLDASSTIFGYEWGTTGTVYIANNVGGGLFYTGGTSDMHVINNDWSGNGTGETNKEFNSVVVDRRSVSAPPRRAASSPSTTSPNFSTATSTFSLRQQGINLTGGGCFSINGTCISGGGSPGTQGQFAFYNTAGTTLTATSSLFLAQSGNIGIGTVTPLATLDVNGTIGAPRAIIFNLSALGSGSTIYLRASTYNPNNAFGGAGLSNIDDTANNASLGYVASFTAGWTALSHVNRSTGFAPGTYDVYVRIRSNGAGNSPTSVPLGIYDYSAADTLLTTTLSLSTSYQEVYAGRFTLADASLSHGINTFLSCGHRNKLLSRLCEVRTCAAL